MIMSGSYVIYESRSFEANDVLLQIWAHLMLEQISKDMKDASWISELVDEWHYQSRESLVGTVHLSLDRFTNEKHHRAMMISWSERALSKLYEDGYVDKDILNKHGVGGKMNFKKDIDAQKIIPIAEKFIHLLKGEMLE